MSKPLTILCIASYFKGVRLMEAAHEAGAHVILVTLESLQDEPWPMDAIAERFLLPALDKEPDITHAISFLARTRKIDRIIALDEYDTEVAARLREHLRVPGLGDTTGRHFRDKLAMRVKARDSGIPVPRFVHALNHAEIAHFMENVPGPWLLKPRTEASAMGIRKINSADELWPLLEEMGDRQSYHLLEEFIPGDVCHVDSVVSRGNVEFASVQRYGQPPLEVYQGGGVFVTTTLPDDEGLGADLVAMNKRLLTAFGMVRGATHAEFLVDRRDGSIRFLEVAARVGGANIDLLVEFATGVNLWAEWARVEIADVRGEDYSLPVQAKRHAGLIVCLAKEEYPNMASYDQEEVVWRLHKKHHAGLVVCSPDYDRMREVLNGYVARFAEDFLAVVAPLSGIDEAREAGAA